MSSLEVALERVTDADDDARREAPDTSGEPRLSRDSGLAPLEIVELGSSSECSGQSPDNALHLLLAEGSHCLCPNVAHHA